jgi:hypothetical protein
VIAVFREVAMRCFPAASLLALSLAGTSLAPALRAQTAETPPVDTRGTEVRSTEVLATVIDDMPGPILTAGGVAPMLLPMLRPITAAPFSASFSSESRQQLADGSYIFKNQTGRVARDNQGRTYNELTHTTSPSTGSRTFTSININDRVAGVQILLHPENHTARRFVRPSGQTPLATSDGILTDGTAAISATTTGGRTVPAIPRDAVSHLHPQVEKQDLGTESMEGLIVSHYLQTQTIPAGEVGNERELTVTNETWYSRDLRINVKQIRKDPRFGEETVTLTEVERGEPPATLFEIPSDYTVTEFPRVGAAPATTGPTGLAGTAATAGTEPPQP